MMLASLTSVSEQIVQQFGYAGLVLIMAVEHIFPPIPSEIVLPLAGYEVGRGNLSLGGTLLAATLGSAIGASVLYLIARIGGRPALLRLRGVLRVDEAALDSAEQRFERHSGRIVFIGRLVPGLRSLVSLPPGLLRMPFGRYLALTAAGSLAWNALLIVAGQQLGSRWEKVAGPVSVLAQVLVVGCVAFAGAWLLRTLSARARRGAQP